MSPLVSARFLQTQPDARLVALARAGYERAFEALVNRYRRQLLAYCRRLSASDAGAEDILQQALLQAWVAIRGDAEVREIRPWLYRIVHNVAISTMRRPQADVIELQAGEGAGGADHEVEQRFAARQALEGLAALPELQREVMLGTALQGRSHEELAATLGLSNGAVRGLIYRARATLRSAAAAFVPGPLVNWAARHNGGGSGRAYEAIAGSGSAGLGGLLLKGGALVATAGALATAGVTASAPSPRHRDAATSRTAARAAAPAHAATELVSDRLQYRSGAQPTGGRAGRVVARRSGAAGNRSSDGHGSSGLSETSRGGTSDGSSRGGSGSTSGERSGSGESSSGSGEGSSGSSGSGDGGGSHTDSGSGGSDGGSSGGSDGGSSGSGSSGSGSGSSGSGSGSGASGSGDSGSTSGGSTSGGSTSGGSSGSDGGSVADGGTTTSDGGSGGSTSGSGSDSGSGSSSDSGTSDSGSDGTG